MRKGHQALSLSLFALVTVTRNDSRNLPPSHSHSHVRVIRALESGVEFLPFSKPPRPPLFSFSCCVCVRVCVCMVCECDAALLLMLAASFWHTHECSFTKKCQFSGGLRCLSVLPSSPVENMHRVCMHGILNLEFHARRRILAPAAPPVAVAAPSLSVASCSLFGGVCPARQRAREGVWEYQDHLGSEHHM